MKHSNLWSKTITTIIALALSACATKGNNTLAMQEAQRFQDGLTQMYKNFNSCLAPIFATHKDYFEKVLTSTEDERKVKLLTLNEPISKQFKATTRDVIGQLSQCEKDTYNSAKAVNSDYAAAFYTNTQNVDMVFIDMINGAFKTYGDFNKKWLQVMVDNKQRSQAAYQRITANLYARHQAEITEENNRMAAAMMMFGAGMQNAGNAYQNSFNNYRNNAPTTTNCRQIGGTVSCSTY